MQKSDFRTYFVVNLDSFRQKSRNPVFKFSVFEKCEHFLCISGISNISLIDFFHDFKNIVIGRFIARHIRLRHTPLV